MTEYLEWKQELATCWNWKSTFHFPKNRKKISYYTVVYTIKWLPYLNITVNQLLSVTILFRKQPEMNLVTATNFFVINCVVITSIGQRPVSRLVIFTMKRLSQKLLAHE